MDDGDVLRRLHGYVTTLPNDKCLDAILNKIGLAILRCTALQNLPLSKSHSALTFPPFVVGVNVSDVNDVTDANDANGTGHISSAFCSCFWSWLWLVCFCFLLKRIAISHHQWTWRVRFCVGHPLPVFCWADAVRILELVDNILAEILDGDFVRMIGIV